MSADAAAPAPAPTHTPHAAHPPHPAHPAPADNPQGNGDDQAQCKEESPRDGVEDLTLDEEAEEQPPVGHNDVVRSEYLI